MRSLRHYSELALAILFLGPVFLLSGLGANLFHGCKPDRLNVTLGMVGTAAQVALLYWISQIH
jgi:hypothetical protein